MDYWEASLLCDLILQRSIHINHKNKDCKNITITEAAANFTI